MPTAPRPRPTGRERPKRRDIRPDAAARGYDHQWATFVAQCETAHNATCELCWRHKRRAVPREALDHVIPFRGLTDPLRLDVEDTRPLCRSCHAGKTKHLDRRIRGYYDKLRGDGVEYERARDITIGKFRFELPQPTDRFSRFPEPPARTP